MMKRLKKLLVLLLAVSLMVSASIVTQADQLNPNEVEDCNHLDDVGDQVVDKVCDHKDPDTCDCDDQDNNDDENSEDCDHEDPDTCDCDDQEDCDDDGSDDCDCDEPDPGTCDCDDQEDCNDDDDCDCDEPDPGTCEIHNPEITVTKMSLQDSWDLFDEVEFTFTVKNTGDVALTTIKLDDPKLGYEYTDTTPLAINESRDYMTSLTYFADEPGDLTNSVYVDASDDSGKPPVDADDTISVSINEPDIQLLKEASADSFNENDTITYTFTIINTGQMPLRDIHLYDAQISDTPFLIGDLEPGEDYILKSNYVVPTDSNSELTNTAHVEAFKVQQGDGYVYDEIYDCLVAADAQSTVAISPVIVVSPNLKLEKTAAESIMLGEDIVYNFVITNTGNDPIVLDELVDELLLDAPYDLSSLDALAPGATHSFSLQLASENVKEALNDEDIVHNEATVYGFDSSDQPITAFATRDVYVHYPELTVTKEADRLDGIYSVNDPVTYTITITNSGNIDFTEVWLYDEDDAGNLFFFDTLVEASEGAFGPGLLVDETAVLTVNTSYSEAYVDLTNWLDVEGYYGESTDYIEASAYSEINIISDVVLSSSTTNSRRTFTISSYDLTVTQSGEGSVSTGFFENLNGVRNLGTIEAAEGWVFDGFYGDDGEDVIGPDDDGQYSIEMNKTRKIEVAFIEASLPQGSPDGALALTVDRNAPQPQAEIADAMMVEEVEVVEELLDATIAEASAMPATGGVPFALPILAGIISITAGLGFRKKTK